MKVSRPGQLCTINNVVYRAVKRVNGCHGCALNSFELCPNIVDVRNGNKPLQCSIDNFVLKRIYHKNS